MSAEDRRPDGDDGPVTDEFFEGIPPEELHQETLGDLPPVEPEFDDAPDEPAADTDGGPAPAQETVEYQVPGAEDTDQEQKPASTEAKPSEPKVDGPRQRPQQVAPKPVRHVVIGREGGHPKQETPTDLKQTAVVPPPAAPPPSAAPPAKPPVAPAPAYGPPQPPRMNGGDPESPPRRSRLWLRFLIAALVIIATAATATTASIKLYFDDIAGKLRPIPGVGGELLPPEEGQPENILILGSDKRAGPQGIGDKGRSDTTLLLRLDPNRGTISLLSIPRDLKVYLGPNIGTGKFNDAYTYGGPQKTLRVVKRLTGLQINHIVNVDFLGFVRAVDAIGCVWVQVDRRYYHSNAGLPASLQYSEIDIQPGYQKLCGKDALAYVRYRHTDTDLVRSARQQDFLREARAQVPAADLFFNDRKKLLDIFTAYTSSDIQSGQTLIDVLKLFVAARNARIEEVHFPGILGPSYVTASKSMIDSAVAKFRGGIGSGGPRGQLERPTNKTGIAAEDRQFKKQPAASIDQPQVPKTPTTSNDGLIDASSGSYDVAAPIAQKVGPGFPVFYPRRLPSGSVYLSAQSYHMHDPDKTRHQAYVEVLQLPTGDYVDIQGVAGWSDPPILKSPSETRTINGREYDIYLDGDRVRLVAWHDGDNSYWVYNSLLQTLSSEQMLGIARSIGEIKPKSAHGR